MTFATHYNVGTVTVTAGSANVVGVGTFWLGNIAPGDILWVNGVCCRIHSVASDTSLTLARNWPGATAPAAYYEAWAVLDAVGYQEATKQLLTKLKAGNLDAIAELASNIDRLPYFTGPGTAALTGFTAFARLLLAAADAASSYAVLGVVPNGQVPPRLRSTGPHLSTAGALDAITETGWNNVPTANNALVNGPPGALGGTVMTFVYDGTTKSQIYIQIVGGNRMWMRQQTGGVWTAWAEVYTAHSIVGTVSQSGGVPTGALFEKGAPASGEYTRLADGSMTCRCRLATTLTCNIAFGTSYYGTATLNFPSVFVNPTTYSVAGAGRASGQLMMLVPDYSTASGSAIGVFMVSPVSFTGLSVDIRATIEGRWF